MSLRVTMLILLTMGLLQAQTGTAHFNPQKPRFPSSSIEFHDPTGERWPCLWVGRTAGEGQVELTEQGARGAFVVQAYNHAMLRSAVSRRILAALLKGVDERKPDPERPNRTTWANDVPMPRVIITQVQGQAERSERRGNVTIVWPSTFTGTLEIAGRSVPFTAEGRINHSRPDGASVVAATMRFTVTAAQLGLDDLDEDAEIRVSVNTAGQM